MNDKDKQHFMQLEVTLLRLREDCELTRLGLVYLKEQFAEQQQLLDLALTLLGLTADDLKVEADTMPEPRELLLRMRRADN